MKKPHPLRRVTKVGEGMGLGLLHPFLRIRKIFPNFGENALIVVIYELNFSFKMQFLRVSRRKNRRFFPALKNSWLRACHPLLFPLFV